MYPLSGSLSTLVDPSSSFEIMNLEMEWGLPIKERGSPSILRRRDFFSGIFLSSRSAQPAMHTRVKITNMKEKHIFIQVHILWMISVENNVLLLLYNPPS